MFIKILDKWVNVNHIENIAVHPSKSEVGMYAVYAGNRDYDYAYLYGLYSSEREAAFAMDDLAKKINQIQKDFVNHYKKE